MIINNTIFDPKVLKKYKKLYILIVNCSLYLLHNILQ